MVADVAQLLASVEKRGARYFVLNFVTGACASVASEAKYEVKNYGSEIDQSCSAFTSTEPEFQRM